MKKVTIPLMAVVMVVNAVVAADAYWKGDGNAWNGKDNPQDPVNGYWWQSSNSGGNWVLPPSGSGVAYINNGKECVITNGTVITGDDVSKIYLNASSNGGTDGSTLTVEDGSTVGPDVGIVVGAVGGNSNTKLSYLHIKGGNLKLGGKSAYALNVGNANDGKDSRGFAWMDGGSLEVSADRPFNIATGSGSIGSFALTNGSMTVKSNTFIGNYTTEAAQSDARFIQAGGVFEEQNTLYLQRNGFVDLCGGRFYSKNLNSRAGGLAQLSGTADASVESLTFDSTSACAMPTTNRLEMLGGKLTVSTMSVGTGTRIGFRGGIVSVRDGLTYGSSNAVVVIDGDARVSVSNIVLQNGGTLQVSGNACASGFIRSPSGSESGDLLSLTNVVEVSGGELTLSNNYTGTTGWFGATKYPMLINVFGGKLWMENLFTHSSKFYKRVTVTDGDLYCEGKILFRWSTVFFKISGAAGSASYEDWDNDSRNYATSGNAALNSISEFEIRKGSVSPMLFREANAIKPFGNIRLYPAGSIGFVGTNTFALMQFQQSSFDKEEDLHTAPDETIWANAWSRINPKVTKGHNWGSTLRPEATSGMLSLDGVANLVTPRAVGYFDLPSIKTNRLNKLDLKLKVLAPTEDVAMYVVLERVKKDLEDAGYANVTTAESATDYNVSFSVLPECLPSASDKTKLIFDFTRISPNLVEYPVTTAQPPTNYPMTTNALLSAVSISRDRDEKGLILIVR